MDLLNERIVSLYTFVPIEELPVLTAIMEFHHQKEWRFWGGYLVRRRRREESKRRKHFRSVLFYCLDLPFIGISEKKAS